VTFGCVRKIETAGQKVDTENSMKTVIGEFVEITGERYYAIRNADRMKPFFISVVSDSDHWLFLSSSGGITAGRISREKALFPYIPVDKVHESWPHTGSLTLLRCKGKSLNGLWQPFGKTCDCRWNTSQHIYKNYLGNKICFEAVNHDLALVFRYTWKTSDKYGFVRQAELVNLADSLIDIEFLDGLQNILPANTPRLVQTEASNLVDAYKWTELEEASGLAMFTLYSGITDKAEPRESLKANTVFCLGLEQHKVLLSSEQIENFCLGRSVYQEQLKRGIRGAYLVSKTVRLPQSGRIGWKIVADVSNSQSETAMLRMELEHSNVLEQAIERSINVGTDRLARIIAGVDGFQRVSEETVSLHHYANTLYNVLRGGVFASQYEVDLAEFRKNLEHFNLKLAVRHKDMLAEQFKKLNIAELTTMAEESGDRQLERLASEYLPITFGRRHGDPSRPWNVFEIKLRDEKGDRLLAYQGNWRDIFQNWEALLWSYPEFIESVIAKFVNASTMDGYNPYRITHQGVDWEVEDLDDPWSYIGYWGDHQIIYLLKLLEISTRFHPGSLESVLHHQKFSYANVPYKIKQFDDIRKNPKDTIEYDRELAEIIALRVEQQGFDGKLLLDKNGDVYLVNLLEKLLVPMLAKLGNLVVDGGIWLNTQRPEWNDANNALVGHGLSMVTLYYLRRYMSFLYGLLIDESGVSEISSSVSNYLTDLAKAIAEHRLQIDSKSLDAKRRFKMLTKLGQASNRYRNAVYSNDATLHKIEHPIEQIKSLLVDALEVLDKTIVSNKCENGMYHAYNLLDMRNEEVRVNRLYAMLEGQVAVLSSGAITPDSAVSVIEALFGSDLYRPDQKTFMLNPDIKLPGFLERNCFDSCKVQHISLVREMLDCDDFRIITKDPDGYLRFNANLSNVNELDKRIDMLRSEYGNAPDSSRIALQQLYEEVFNHRAFVGRSGTMFGFEGLGCVYWHMVAKLLLAIQENYFSAIDQGCITTTIKRLGDLYYQVRNGIGYNKTPEEYGAFPTDAYSHTPKHAGAQQPGMTGQVKEEIITRFGELGIRVNGGQIDFQPTLLRRREFGSDKKTFRYLDVDNNWKVIMLSHDSLAFTWCQVPIVYQLGDELECSLSVITNSNEKRVYDYLTLPKKESAEIFRHSGLIRQLTIKINRDILFGS
jgi:hypothetical protein